MKKSIILCIGLLVSASACQRAFLPGSYTGAVSQPAQNAAPEQLPGSAQAAATHEEPNPVPDGATYTQTTVLAPDTEPVLLADSREGSAALATRPIRRLALAPQVTAQEKASQSAKSRTQEQRLTKKILKKMAKPVRIQASKSARKAQALTGLQIAGIVVGSVGFLLFLLVSWLLGLLLMGGGLLMVLLGKGGSGGGRVRTNTNNSGNGDMQDVVYLKNGSVIKGMIVEQIPNQSIKIRTSDGSVFVYEMAEVTKITKE